MAKVNFSRVEELIGKGMHKIKKAQLLELADVVCGKKKKTVELDILTPHQIMIIVDQDMKWMKKKNREVYSKLKIKKARIQELLTIAKNQGEKITQKKLDEIKEITEEVASFKKEHYHKMSDDELIEAEKKRHITKRQNVNEKWLPLK